MASGPLGEQFRLGLDFGVGPENATRMFLLGAGMRVGPFDPTTLTAAIDLWARVGQGPTERFALLIGIDLMLEWGLWDSRD